MKHLVDGPALLARRLDAAAVRRAPAAALAAAAAAAEHETPPPEIVEALAAYRLLHDVPFNVLVADTRLLPEESMRFFVVDDEWVAAIERGALSVGTVGSREVAHAAMAERALGDAARRRTGTVRASRVARLGGRTAGTSSAAVMAAGSAPVTGFVLRSALVSRWPGLAIRAWATDDPALLPDGADPDVVAAEHPELVVGILRLEQLAPSVLLALFAGTPRTVWLEEPHHGVQFGVDVDVDRTVSLVDPTGHLREDLPRVPVRDRAGGAPGVLDVGRLVTDIATAGAGQPGVLQQAGSATLALVLLRPPVRQRFAVSAAAEDQ